MHFFSVTTIVGASDDLGLGLFQGVTTQLDDRILDFGSRHSSESDDAIDSTQISNKPLSRNGSVEPRSAYLDSVVSEATKRTLLGADFINDVIFKMISQVSFTSHYQKLTAIVKAGMLLAMEMSELESPMDRLGTWCRCYTL